LKYPIPAELWSAAASAVPASGNYIHVESDNGLGGKTSRTYTNANSVIGKFVTGLAIRFYVIDTVLDAGDFVLPSAAGTLQAGYFPNLGGTYPTDAALGTVIWSGGATALCTKPTGWLVIDKIALSGEVMTAIDLRFEYRCGNEAALVRGQIHWTLADANTGHPPGPQAIPASLWKPDAAALPASGNYLYMESAPGDWVGGGRTYLYTAANATIKLKSPAYASSGPSLAVDVVAGSEIWTSEIVGMNGLSEFAPGYYGPYSLPGNAVFGRFSWIGMMRGCQESKGWFAIDKVSYNGPALTSVDLRFEQSCGATGAPLRGQLHWTASGG
jgi:hypothetical protein